MTESTIKSILCRFLYMKEEYYYIDDLLILIELKLKAGMPLPGKNISLYLDFEDFGNIDGETLCFGFISALIETETTYTDFRICGCCDTYGKKKTLEEAEESIIDELELIQNIELQENKYDNFWDSIDFDSLEFIRKK